MKCLNCRKCEITLTTEICPECSVYIPHLMRHTLKPDTMLHNNSYKIEYPLGRGGFGITYQALHINLEEKVAIKEFCPDKDISRNNATNALTVVKTKEEIFQKNLEKFKREGKILAKLRNPNIVQARDLFEENNTAYLVMELLEGNSLRDELDKQNKKCFTIEKAKSIVESIVNALDTIHQAGIYHLDIKPDNIMVDNKGRIVLIDFGSAKQAETASRSTGSFTEIYAPPEVMSRPDDVGVESDIFELGMMFHELLTGKRIPNAIDRLYSGETSWKVEGISSPWKELIEQAVEIKKEKRPKSVKEWWKQANNQVKVDNKPNPIVLESKSQFITSKIEISKPKPILPKSTDKFEFETVKVDIAGKIIKRTKGKANQRIEDLGNGIKLEMVEIPAGTFLMGSPSSETNRNDDESPQHQVTIPQFYLGKYQITQEQYQAIMGDNPSNFKGEDLPVEQVTWHNAVEFCKKLSEKTGKAYRLPSEAEWEYACRAGTTTPFAFGQTITPNIVNYNGNYPYGQAVKGEYRTKTIPVGSLGVANGFGLYDMHGNVWEWCQDEWHKSYNDAPVNNKAWEDKFDNKNYHVLRGGSWTSFSSKCRSALRRAYAPIDKFNFLGFRVALDIPNITNKLEPKPETIHIIEVISSPKLILPKSIDKFEFETVTLDIKGNIVEKIKKQANQHVEDLGDGIKLEMVEIPAGSFLMGTSEKDREKEIAEVARYWDKDNACIWIGYQTPQHQVTVPQFYIGKYQVTQKQYQAIMGNNPSNFQGDNSPVEQVTWHNVVEFCKKLSAKTGKNYRLPSEAEWEYACRAGTTTPFAFGQTITPDIVNYDGNYPYGQAIKGVYRAKTTPVGSLGIANAFGLYDMHGNVWEWCQDVWHNNYNGAPTNGSGWEQFNSNNTHRILRGGSWVSNAYGCRSASRRRNAMDDSYYLNGFRVALDIPNITNKLEPKPETIHIIEVVSNPKPILPKPMGKFEFDNKPNPIVLESKSQPIPSKIEIISNPIPVLPKPVDKFEFETVTVDIKGNIVERIKKQANQHVEDFGDGIKLEMVEIPAGTFLMGSPYSEANRTSYEGPQHQVNVSKFYLGKYQMTQKQYQVIIGNNPSSFKDDDLPVEKVTWHNAVEFCKKLSEKTGKAYRLPSEAEWEYACRAGTTSPFAFGQTITPDIVNYNGNYPYQQAIKGEYRAKTTPVGSLGVANAFGLYDLHGNVCEWCQDIWHDNYNGAPRDGRVWETNTNNNTYRILRGGSWCVIAIYCRSALRIWCAPDGRYDYVGFRVALDIPNITNTPKPETTHIIEVINNPKPILPKPIDKFEFETVTVDIRGNIVERTKKQANQYIEDLGNGIKLEMVELPAGSFIMGSSSSEGYNSEKPQHQVNVKAFYLGKYPITQKQYQTIMGNNSSSFKGDDLPIETVTWHNVVEFCKKLSVKTGKNYRLPSEAEWEYACRAGTTTPFAFGQTITPDIVNYNGNYPYGQAIKGQYRQKTTPVGSLDIANGFGLYDMYGNVWEWCQDIWHYDYNGAPTNSSVWEDSTSNHTFRVFRGGSWLLSANNCRSANRNWSAPNFSCNDLGFRVALDVESLK